jgi:hypothetical protein
MSASVVPPPVPGPPGPGARAPVRRRGGRRTGTAFAREQPLTQPRPRAADAAPDHATAAARPGPHRRVERPGRGSRSAAAARARAGAGAGAEAAAVGSLLAGAGGGPAVRRGVRRDPQRHRPASHLRAVVASTELHLVADQLVRRTTRVYLGRPGATSPRPQRVRLRALHVSEPRDGVAEVVAVLEYGANHWAMSARLERRSDNCSAYWSRSSDPVRNESWRFRAPFASGASESSAQPSPRLPDR